MKHSKATSSHGSYGKKGGYKQDASTKVNRVTGSVGFTHEVSAGGAGASIKKATSGSNKGRKGMAAGMGV